MTPPRAATEITAPCRVGPTDLASWLVANGWARPAEDADAAAARRIQCRPVRQSRHVARRAATGRLSGENGRVALGDEFAGKRPGDQRPRLGNAVDRDERTEARAPFLAEQRLVQRLEPCARNARARRSGLSVRCPGSAGWRAPRRAATIGSPPGRRRRAGSRASRRARRAPRAPPRPARGTPSSAARSRCSSAPRSRRVRRASGASPASRRATWRRMKPHSTALSWVLEALARFSSIANDTGRSTGFGWPEWMCHTGLPSSWSGACVGKAVEEGEILVHRLRDDVEVELLRRARPLEHVEREALRRGVGQPLVDGDAVALRLRNLLPVFVEEEFVVEALRRRAAERGADLRRQLHRIDQVLARHLVVDAERRPAHRPVGLPLALHVAAGYRHFGQLVVRRVAEHDRPGVRRCARGSAPAARRRSPARAAGTANRSAAAPRRATAA